MKSRSNKFWRQYSEGLIKSDITFIDSMYSEYTDSGQRDQRNKDQLSNHKLNQILCDKISSYQSIKSQIKRDNYYIMFKTPICKFSQKKANKICVDDKCNIYPFICRFCEDMECQANHKHDNKFIKSMIWTQLQSQLTSASKDETYKKYIEKLEIDVKNFINDIVESFKKQILDLDKKIQNYNVSNQDKIYQKLSNGNYNDLVGRQINQLLSNLGAQKKKQQKEKQQFYVIEIQKIVSKINQMRQKFKEYLMGVEQIAKQANALMQNKKFVEAQKLYDKILKLDSNTADYYYKKGLACFRQAKWKIASVNLHNAIKLDEKQIPYYQLRGLAEYNDSNFQKAQKIYSQALELEKKEVYFLKKAQCLQKLEKFQDCDATLTQALKQYPKSINLLSMKAIGCLQMARFSEAQKLYEKLINQQKNVAQNYFGCGLACFDQRKFKQAFKYFVEAIRIDDKIANFHLHLANTYKQLTSFPEAEKHYQKAIDLINTNPNYHYKLAELYIVTGKLSQAAKCYEKAVQLDPQQKDYCAKLINLRIQQKEFAKAEKQLQRASKIGLPEDLRCFQKGNIQNLKRNPTKALQYFNEAIKINNNESKYYFEKAETLVQLKNFTDQTLDCYEQAIRLKPNNPQYHNKKGKFHFHRKQYDSAEYQHRRALDVCPQVKYFSILSKYLVLQNKFNEAYQIVKRGMNHHPKSDQLMDQKNAIGKKLSQNKQIIIVR